LVGNLGRDAETRPVGGGAPMTTFSMATSRSYKSNGEWKTDTEWHNIVAFNKEKLAERLKKGRMVYVCGEIRTREYEDRETGQKKRVTNIVADQIVIMAGGSEDREPEREHATTPEPEAPGESLGEDDVPF
jgi:single-strand DNA-binding protein